MPKLTKAQRRAQRNKKPSVSVDNKVIEPVKTKQAPKDQKPEVAETNVVKQEGDSDAGQDNKVQSEKKQNGSKKETVKNPKTEDVSEEVDVQEESDLPDNTDTDSSEEAGDIEDASGEVEETEEERKAREAAEKEEQRVKDVEKRLVARKAAFIERYCKGMSLNIVSSKNRSSQLSCQKELYSEIKAAFKSPHWRSEVAELITLMRGNKLFTPTYITRHVYDQNMNRQLPKEFETLATIMAHLALYGISKTALSGKRLVTNIEDPVIKQNIMNLFEG